MCRLERRWQEEDQEERPGRRSYMRPTEALQRLCDDGRLMRGKVVATNSAGVRRRA